MGSTYTVILSILLLQCYFQEKGVWGATFTFVNKCSQTIWPGILGNPNLDSTGFELPKGSSRSIQAPTGWSGRFWGRTGCTFDESGRGSCITGDCGSGELECKGAGATAATLAEFTLGSGSMDFYDVSLVDGYNLPLMIDATGGSGQCASTGCPEDLNHKCPAELRAGNGGACRSACDAFGTPEYCCKGPEYGSPATCKPSAYSQAFKSACPNSYSYAYDDATSTFTCTAANYIITFCPFPSSQKSSKPDNGTDGSESGSESGSGSEVEPEPGSVQEVILADGSWLARLATGDSPRTQSYSANAQILAMILVLLYLFAAFLPFES